MKNNTIPDILENRVDIYPNKIALKLNSEAHRIAQNLPEILILTSYPPRECGIATYSQDLIRAIKNKFNNSFQLKVCAIESGNSGYSYPDEVKYILNTNSSQKYTELANSINTEDSIKLVLIQHEFGLFQHTGKDPFRQLLCAIHKPIIIVFHTVLPHPNKLLKEKVEQIAASCESVVVMTKNAAHILNTDYGVPIQKIAIIEHGTHLVLHLNKSVLKTKYGLAGKKVLSTFGLLSSGKGIVTTLDSLAAIIKLNPDIVFLVIGKTHPGVIASEGENYRNLLEAKVAELNLHQHVKFINHYLPLQDLLEYLQLTDIYLFTSNDPNQAVSGTFSYAMSCGCPIISTPIPHAKEVLTNDTGIIIDFQNPHQLANAVNRLMNDETLRMAFSSNTLQRIVPTAWENSAIAHALLIQRIAVPTTNGQADAVRISPSKFNANRFREEKIPLQFRLPEINLEHIKKMTTDFGMMQFSKANQPDIQSGYTLDDNARALIAMCMNYELTHKQENLNYITIYLNFIKYCLQPTGNFLNYVDSDKRFTEQNNSTNLSDANGRGIWALGYLISKSAFLPPDLIATAKEIIEQALPHAESMYSTRSIAFTIKGLYYLNLEQKLPQNSALIETLANRLVQMYRHESEKNWKWFESYLTYANSILPEALLCAWQDTKDPIYKKIAKTSFDFLLLLTFNQQGIKLISNKSWLHKGQQAANYGEQPIDVTYTLLALSRFYEVFGDVSYLNKINKAFNWFLGSNHLHQIIYNPCTGGCYDGLEETHVNLNQGAESTLSYLMARLTIEKHFTTKQNPTSRIYNAGFVQKV